MGVKPNLSETQQKKEKRRKAPIEERWENINTKHMEGHKKKIKRGGTLFMGEKEGGSGHINSSTMGNDWREEKERPWESV